jgi:DNA-binding transcriptional LysR family regulator
MTQLDLTTLRLFLAVVRGGSIQQAAREENIAASAVSRRISDLEMALGVPLLRRQSSGVEPTAAGRLLAEEGRNLFRAARDLVGTLQGFSGGTRGEVILAAVSSAFSGPLPEILASFLRVFPDITVRLEETYSRQAGEAVRDGRVDLAIIAENPWLQGLESDVFCDDPIWVMTPLDHPLLRGLAPGEAVAYADATEHPTIALHEGGVLDEILRHAGGQAPPLGKRVTTVNRVSSLRRLVEAGLGIGFMRRSGIEPFLGRMDILGAPLSDPWSQLHLIIVRRQGSPLSPATERLYRHLMANRPDPLPRRLEPPPKKGRGKGK